MRTSENTIFKILVGLLFVVVVFTSYTMGQVSVAKGPESLWSYAFSSRKDTKIGLVGEALTTVKARYYKPIEDDQQLVYGALNGMINSLHEPPYSDPYSGFLDVTSWSSLKATTQGSYAGIGVLVGPHESEPFPVIVTVFPDSPAAKAGIKENDVIIEVDGVSTQDKVLDEAARMIKGEIGTTVKLKIMRANLLQPLEFSVVRQPIEVHSVSESKVLDDGSGYIRLVFFSETTPSEVEKVLEKFQKDGVKNVIIDLRNNTGGLLDGAIGVADMFIKEGDIVSVEMRGRKPEVHQADPTRLKYKFGLVLLVNGNSASASEVLAGALRDYGLAVLVGEKTFGKGVVQEVIELDNRKVAIALTIGRYLTPKGHDLGGTGLEPDIKVEFDKYIISDPVLSGLQKQMDQKHEEIRKLTDEMIQKLTANDFQLKEGQKAFKQKPKPAPAPAGKAN
jgi:carboxyl-terminal processing protease